MSYSIEDINQRLALSGKPHIIAKTSCEKQKDYIQLYCTKHNKKWTATFDKAIRQKYSCRSCEYEDKARIKKITTNLFDTRPDIANMLENPDDAIGLTPYSSRKYWFICPKCKNALYKSLSFVSKKGLCCGVCSDHFSYPNKLMFYILKNLGIKTETEYSPAWIKRRRFDFHFYINNLELIIEMDGGLGHGKKVFGKNNSIISVKETKRIDNEKDKIARLHGIIVIRIDAQKSELNYIKQNILNSDLSKYVSLSLVDWDWCENQARESRVAKVCSMYADYPYLSLNQLAEYFEMHVDTISKYLKIGYERGMCPQYTMATGNPILCTDSQIIFRTCSEAADYYGLSMKRVSMCCNGKLDSISSLHFIKLKDYTGDISSLQPDYSVKPKRASAKKKVNMYSSLYVYEGTFDSIADAARQNKISSNSVSHSCIKGCMCKIHKFFYYADDINQPDQTKIIVGTDED